MVSSIVLLLKYNETQHGIYIILEIHWKFDLLQNNYNSLLMGIETLHDAKQVQLILCCLLPN